MRTLNSMHSRGMATTVVGMSVLAIAALLLLSAPFFSFAAGTTITVSTDKASYPSATGTPITVNGTISPAPGISNTYATIQIKDGSGTLKVIDSTPVDPTTGAFSDTLASGAGWANGTYTALVTWAAGAGATVYTGSVTFVYGAPTPVTTSTTSSASVTTIVNATTITSITTVQSITTIQQVTTVASGTTIVSATTISQGGASTTVEALAIVGIVIAIIAGALAAMALRKH